ncbi:hypothetical protein P8452_60620 [Trifolium repens]|nr:hypothetical protein P8452_60620 [Trifolium repens]
MDSIYNQIYNKLINFVGELPVRTLHELLNVESNGVSVVPVWFDSVVEGVDVWFSDDQCKGQPKLRMKIKVKHVDQVAVFALYDDDVQHLAVETCPILLALGESCSLYPDEMESYFGDAFLCKVEKKDDQDFNKLPSFVVSAMCRDVGMVDMFFDEYLPDFDVFAGSSAKIFSGVSEVPAVLHSDCGSNEVVSGDTNLLTSPPSVNGKASSIEPTVPDFEVGSPSTRSMFYRRRSKSFKGRFSTSIETLIYSKRKSCIKRKLNFDEAILMLLLLRKSFQRALIPREICYFGFLRSVLVSFIYL